MPRDVAVVGGGRGTLLCLHTQTQSMGTKTIGIRDEVYAELKARKREDESFSDVVTRLLEEASIDWRDGFGTLSEGDADELEALVDRSREQLGTGLADRQQEALEALAGDDDETA